MSSSANQLLRQQMRATRNRLPQQIQDQCGKSLVTHLIKQDFFHAAKHIGAYCAFDGEIPLHTLLFSEAMTDKTLLLPKILSESEKSMTFYPTTSDEELETNNWGIKEPQDQQDAQTSLDLILVPLVAYGPNGTRLGMGAGFYDRALKAMLKKQKNPPVLVGCVYSFQHSLSIKTFEHDIQMDYIASEAGISRAAKD